VSDERASVLERLSSAMAGGGDPDVVAALGLAQAASGDIGARNARGLGLVAAGIGSPAQISAIGAHLTRLQAAASQLSFAQAAASISALVDRLNDSRRWGLSEAQVERIAHNALLLHLNPVCPACEGRKFELIPGTPHVGERRCNFCHGTGQRPYPRRHGEKVQAVMSVLGWIQGLMEKAVARRIA
jgi:hypothetical protein